MSALDYKGWQIELNPSKVPDADGWRIYVTVIADTGEAVQTVPLSFNDGRVFSTKEAADQAGIELAKVWIDHQG